MLRISHVLLMALLSIWVVSAQAALDLELTQGVNAALPIAIIPFKNAKPNVPGNTTLSAVMKNDLQNSGQFRVKSQPTQTDGQGIDFAALRKQGVNDVVVGDINFLGEDIYQVNLKLVSVFGNHDVLLEKTYRVKQSGLRRLAHRLSDLVYEKLTGVRGIFSTQIAYVLVKRVPNKLPEFKLEISDIDGFEPHALLKSSQPIMSPTWLPDGSGIAYVSFENFRPEVYLQNLASGQRQLISTLPGINSAPAFSPDGTKLALVLSRTGNPKIYLLDIQSKQLTQLTHGSSIDTEPSWAPDGKSILFTSSRGGTPQIYRYYFSNKDIQRVTFDGNYNAHASFMPTEKSIVMMHRQTGLFGIARQDLANGRVLVLAQTGSDESPSVAPNGRMIIYATQYSGRGVLAVVSVDGRVKLRLPAREGSVQEPAWSPYLTS